MIGDVWRQTKHETNVDFHDDDAQHIRRHVPVADNIKLWFPILAVKLACFFT